jgi:hypothetical protein
MIAALPSSDSESPYGGQGGGLRDWIVDHVYLLETVIPFPPHRDLRDPAPGAQLGRLPLESPKRSGLQCHCINNHDPGGICSGVQKARVVP